MLDGKIYVTGGTDTEVDEGVNTVEAYDLRTNTWSWAPPMATVRKYHCMAVLGGKIYSAGGYDGEDYLASVEAFDPLTNTWAAVAPMSTKRGDFALVMARGKLYAVGGTNDDDEEVATTEAYDPQQDRWEAVAPMVQARRVMAAIGMP